jgi:hypothetical protein
VLGCVDKKSLGELVLGGLRVGVRDGGDDCRGVCVCRPRLEVAWKRGVDHALLLLGITWIVCVCAALGGFSCGRG